MSTVTARTREPAQRGRVQAAMLADGRRLHLNHGPIDLVIEAHGAPDEVRRAYAQAVARFDGLLAVLVEELAALRTPVGETPPSVTPDDFHGPVARRMAHAVWPHRAVFVTPMAAVAGAVADEMLAALAAGRRLARAYVNDGGDIALHLAPGARFDVGMVTRMETAHADGRFAIDAGSPVRGIATSGRGGRSLSLGIADAVTVLARDAATADAAATLVANAVNVTHPAIERRAARDIDPDSDLGQQPVTLAVGPLPPTAVESALDNGAACARTMRERGLIFAAVLALNGRTRVVGTPHMPDACVPYQAGC